MPYRRLPNTDASRLAAMKIAYKVGRELHPQDLAYSQSTYTRLGLFINSFEQAVAQYRQAYDHQSQSSIEYQQVSRKARLYVSHFLQVVNLAILRGELKPAVREFYGLAEDESKLPSLSSDQDVVTWGQRVIDGEFERTSRGHTPIMNPTIARVKVQYEQFYDAFMRQKVLQQNTARTLGQLNDLRDEADEIIVSIWNEVEETFAERSDAERRRCAMGYGVKYVYRKNEPRDDEIEDRLISPDTVSLVETFARKSGIDSADFRSP